jgi:hypothetical protein
MDDACREQDDGQQEIALLSSECTREICFEKKSYGKKCTYVLTPEPQNELQPTATTDHPSSSLTPMHVRVT